MEKKFVGFLCFVFIFRLVGCATPGKENLFYDVKGITLEEIKKSMDQQKRIHAKGRNAYTKWRVNYNFSKNKISDGCVMGQVNVRMTITTVMPRLVSFEKLSPELQKKWNTYLKNQLKHEMIQKEFGLKAKKEVEEKLLAMKKDDCQRLNQNANALGDSIVEKYVKSRNAYNKETNYGAKSGATFP